jgi:hypothetical protein
VKLALDGYAIITSAEAFGVSPEPVKNTVSPKFTTEVAATKSGLTIGAGEGLGLGENIGLGVVVGEGETAGREGITEAKTEGVGANTGEDAVDGVMLGFTAISPFLFSLLNSEQENNRGKNNTVKHLLLKFISIFI